MNLFKKNKTGMRVCMRSKGTKQSNEGTGNI